MKRAAALALAVVVAASIAVLVVAEDVSWAFQTLPGTIVFSSNRGPGARYNLYRVRMANYHEVECLTCAANTQFNMHSPKMHPKGAGVLFLSDNHLGVATPDQFRLWYLDFTTNQMTQLHQGANTVTGATFSNDGATVFMVSAGRIWSKPFATAASAPLVGVACMTGNIECKDIVLDRNGTVMYYSQRDTGAGDLAWWSWAHNLATGQSYPLVAARAEIANRGQHVVASSRLASGDVFMNYCFTASECCLAMTRDRFNFDCIGTGNTQYRAVELGPWNQWILMTTVDRRKLMIFNRTANLWTDLEFARSSWDFVADNSLYWGASWSVNEEPQRRGMYISPYTTSSGGVEFSTNPQLFGIYSNIIDSDDKIDELLSFARANNVNALSFYNLGSLLPDKAPQLRNFIRRARISGIYWVDAIGGETRSRLLNIAQYQNSTTDELSRFDTFLTEIEYWNEDDEDVARIVDAVNYMRSLNPRGRGHRPFLYAAYVGWINATDVPRLDAVLDIIMVHAYVKNPSSAFGYTSTRLGYIAQHSTRMQVHIIYSTEGREYSAGSEYFMGDWWNATARPFEVAEATFLSSLGASSVAANIMPRFGGFQYFSYRYTRLYMPARVTPPRRGMYISLYTDRLGAIRFNTNMNLYGRMNYILDSPHTNVELVLRFIRKHKVNALSLYNMNVILSPDYNLAMALRAFMCRARNAGVLWIEAIGATYLPHWEYIVKYQNASLESCSMTDGANTEIEYWHDNPKNVATLIDPVVYVKSRYPARRPGALRPYYFAAYIGTSTAADITAMAAHIDSLYIHAYVRDPATSYNYVKARLDNMLSLTSMTYAPIFSAEGTQYAAGSEYFMGEWLADPTKGNKNLTIAEDIFKAAAFAQGQLAAANQHRMLGFQWYEFFFMGMYIQDPNEAEAPQPTMAPVTPVPGGPTPPPTTQGPVTATTAPPSPTPTAPTTSASSVPAGTNATDVPTNTTTNATGGTTAPPMMTTTVPVTPRPQTPAPTQPMKITRKTLRISGTQWGIVISQTETQLRIAIRSDLATILRVPASRIVVINIRIGSLIAEYDVLTEETVSDAQMNADVVSSTFSTTVGLYRTWTGDTSAVAVTNSETISSAPAPLGAFPPTPAPPSGTPVPPSWTWTPSPGTGGSGDDGGGSKCSTGCVVLIVVVLACVLVAGAGVGFLLLRRGGTAAVDSTSKRLHGGSAASGGASKGGKGGKGGNVAAPYGTTEEANSGIYYEP